MPLAARIGFSGTAGVCRSICVWEEGTSSSGMGSACYFIISSFNNQITDAGKN